MTGTDDDDGGRGAGSALASFMAEALARLRRRRAIVFSGLMLSLGYLVLAGLPLVAALTGSVVILALAVGLPDDDESSRVAAPTGDRNADVTSVTWRAMLDAVPDPVIALDAESTVVHLNPAARAHCPSARIGGGIGLVSRDPALLAAIEEATMATDPRSFELHERVPIERRIQVTLSAVPEVTGGLKGPAFVLLLKDLTEQDRLARMRADFVANASHELRTPLSSLTGFIETLQGRADTDPAARTRFLVIMSEQASRMRRLVDDLLSLSRVEMREHLPPQDTIDLADAVGDAIETLEPVARKAGVTLEFANSLESSRVKADHDEIVQVIQNLVQNAIKYGRAGGKVTVEMAREGIGPDTRLAVKVTDNGPGIAPEHLPRLTERFYRVSAQTSREKGGTGLGLAIVKHILNRHRGELRISSKLGQGSTFVAVLDEVQSTSDK